jgi:methionine salvage enolase-phosphatase E1
MSEKPLTYAQLYYAMHRAESHQYYQENKARILERNQTRRDLLKISQNVENVEKLKQQKLNVEERQNLLKEITAKKRRSKALLVIKGMLQDDSQLKTELLSYLSIVN